MTPGHTPVERCASVAALLLALSVPFAGTARAQPAEPSQAGTVIEVLSANVQGKNVFIPSTLAVMEGSAATLSVFNSTDTPHGFAIAELGIEAVLTPGQETRISLPPIEGPRILRIGCHLHPPHRSAQLLVLEDD